MHHPRQDSTYHGLCYTSCGALGGTRNSSVGPPRGIDQTIHCTMSYHEEHLAPQTGTPTMSSSFFKTSGSAIYANIMSNSLPS